VYAADVREVQAMLAEPLSTTAASPADTRGRAARRRPIRPRPHQPAAPG